MRDDEFPDVACHVLGQLVAAPLCAPAVGFFFKALRHLLELQPNATLHALLAAPRALVPLSRLKQLASTWFGGDAGRRLLERAQQQIDNPAARIEGEAAGSLEEFLPLFLEAWELEHANQEQRIRQAFAAAQPASGVFTLEAFTALVRSLEGGAALEGRTVEAMYQAALDCSGGLLEQAETDVVLLEAFVYVCRSAGL